jgi:hypothetical protein
MDDVLCDTCGEPMTVRLDHPELGAASARELTCANGHEVYVPAEADGRSRIEKLRAISRSGMAAQVDGYLVDIQTAGLLVTVHDALSRKNRAKFGRLSLPRLVDFAWSVAK